MRNLLLMLMFSCVCAFADASVLGIFEDTNFPAGIVGERDGVHRLEIIDNELYAATEKGIFKYSESSNTWSLWALENVNVMDFKANGDEIVAIIAPQDTKGSRAVELARIIRFNRNESEWEDITSAGMGYNFYDQIITYVMRLAQHPSEPHKLMVVAYPGIWISEDFGTSWQSKTDCIYTYNEHQFLGWHPANNSVLFYTNENDAFATEIQRSGNGGQDWDIINPDANGDNSCHCLAFDPENPNHILYSGEGCIFESDDCGISWHCVYRQDYHNQESPIGYAYNIMYDRSNNNILYAVILYAVGCSSDGYIHIFTSSDNGKTWRRIVKSDKFYDKEYWIFESVILNGKLYIYTRKGVLTYSLDNNSGIRNIMTGNNNGAEMLYDLWGRRVIAPQTGTIYMRGGKKIIAN